jgi:hypothetical protein
MIKTVMIDITVLYARSKIHWASLPQQRPLRDISDYKGLRQTLPGRLNLPLIVHGPNGVRYQQNRTD